MSRIGTRLGFMALTIVAGVIPASAQGTQTASLSGQAVDRTGKKLEGVRVVLSSPSMQGQRIILSGEDGRFIARLLPPGTYTISLSKEGFESVTLTQRIGLEQISSPRVTLSPVGSAVVEIVATAAGADKAEFKTAINYTKDAIDSLPVNRDSALSVAYLSPGVVQSGNAAQGEIEIRGAQGSGNLVMVDGQNIMDNLYGGQRIGTIFEAVEETQVLTGAIPAEYGYIEGGVINQITKSGGNEFSGSVRWDLQNPAWNAYAPQQSRGSLPNNLTDNRSVTFGGPIVKDILWFFGGYFDSHPSTPATFTKTTGRGPGGYVPPMGPIDYIQNQSDYRREMKLTFSPNSTNTLTATYNNSKLAYNRSVGAGEEAALAQFATTGKFWNLSWRSILTTSLTLTARYGTKEQSLGNEKANPLSYFDGLIISRANGAYYGSGYWDHTDPMFDQRKNKTAAIKLSAFWSAAGSHETDLGFDNYVGTIEASGYQSSGRVDIPGIGSNLDMWRIRVNTYDPLSRKFAWDDGGAYMDVLQYVPDKLTTNLNGLYINDKWTLDSHWLFNIGLRFDWYDSKSLAVGKVASASTLSPRLGMKFDLFGDSKLVAGLSFSRLQGRPLESTLSGATYVNNAVSYRFFSNGTFGANSDVTAAGNAGAAAESTWYDLSRLNKASNPLQYFDTTPGSYSYTNAALNVTFDPHLKPTQVDEMQATLTYNFKHPEMGSGFVRATAVQKTWSNLQDAIVGQNGSVSDPSGNILDINYWTNSSDAEKKYKSLELDGQLQRGAWFLAANITWSDLRGNYVGEGLSSPGSGEFLRNYDIYPVGTVNYNWKTHNPTGRLATIGAQSPLAYNVQASHMGENSYGKVTFGLNYRFRSGQHYNVGRTYDVGTDVPNLAANPNSHDITVFQFADGRRGTGVFNGFANLDASLQQDFTIAKVREKAVVGYIKISAFNVWNHQQQLRWDTAYAEASTLGDPWTPTNSATFGKPRSASDFAAPRSYLVSAGVKF
ncbi:MAG: TonB-dependent receptor [Acidobacteria bacterium]|nr:TonB-dependent receptor [Acidobacteriota bacterium]MBI3488810.1 TonB-dependent receptor [Acidobacteriota bacterium]